MGNKQPNDERLPPNSPEAEAGVIGCILAGGREVLAECAARFESNSKRPAARLFYDLRYAAVFRACQAAEAQQRAVDIVTVAEALKAAGQLEEVGGLAWLAGLNEAIPSVANAEYYADIVWEKYLLREMLRTLVVCGQSIYEWTGPVPELLDEIESRVLAVNAEQGTGAKLLPELVSDRLDAIENAKRGVGVVEIRTHFGYLDKKIGGLKPKNVFVLSGVTSSGKTSLALNMAENVALIEKVPVGVFSLEMSAEDLTDRLLASQAEVNLQQIRDGFAKKEDPERLLKISPGLSAAPIYIDDASGLSILQLKARARRMRHRYGCRVFVIDYLQLLTGSRDYGPNRAAEVTEISHGVKALAKELDAAVLLLSQFSREGSREGRRPRLSDLKESSSIEQDADVVGLLYRPKSDGDEDGSDEDGGWTEGPMVLKIGKNRNGPCCNVELYFKKWCTRYYDGYGNKGRMPSNQELGISAAKGTTTDGHR